MAKSDSMFRVGIVLIPGFSLMAFASTVEPLRSANLMHGSALYSWTHLSPDGGMVEASGGLEVLTTALTMVTEANFDLVVVCGGLGCERYDNAFLATFLRQTTRRGAIVGSVSTASFILAGAGLLDNRRCTVHWDYLDAFVEAFPNLDISSELFVVDRGIFTCAGGTAALDMMLQFIREQQGDSLANLVSDQFIHGTVRQPRDDQRMALRNRLNISHPLIIKAVEIMEDTIESPLSTAVIAQRVGVSTRQLERLFQRNLSSSPTRHYCQIRLKKAQRLLRLTTLSVIEIAVACGFVSASHFSLSYRMLFGIVPSEDRQQELVRFAQKDSRKTGRSAA